MISHPLSSLFAGTERRKLLSCYSVFYSLFYLYMHSFKGQTFSPCFFFLIVWSLWLNTYFLSWFRFQPTSCYFTLVVSNTAYISFTNFICQWQRSQTQMYLSKKCSKCFCRIAYTRNSIKTEQWSGHGKDQWFPKWLQWDPLFIIIVYF